MGKLTKYTLQIVVASLIVWLATVMVFTEEIVFRQSEDSSTQVVVPEGAEFEDGTYSATVDGHNGPLSLDVTIEGGNIAAVDITDHVESEGIADPAIADVPAAIVEANSTAVDSVSGATVTSDAIITAVNTALAESAGGDATAIAPVVEEETEEDIVEEETEETEVESEASEEVEEESSEEAVVYTDGTYTAEVEGHNGPVEVEVTVADNVISEVEILTHEETDGISDPAIEEVPAAIIENNSTDIDTVSGATVTSEAIIEAVNLALEDANEETETVVYNDGTYTAEVEGHNGPVEVEVTVEEGVITAVEILSHEETDGISDPAIEEVPAAIVENNSPEVDTVSGATVTSEAIIEAVKLALEDAI